MAVGSAGRKPRTPAVAAGVTDELGAHVSTRGGLERAPERAAALASACLQMFTKQPSRWQEPSLSAEDTGRFRGQLESHGIVASGSHDSYLVNLASPDPELRERSYRCFRGELERARAMGLDFVVTHPGNATDGDRASGLARNGDALARALQEVDPSPRVLVEVTAGSGNALGCTFRELADLLDHVPGSMQGRVGVCFDTCHAWAAGYDLVGDFEGVWAGFEDALGFERLGLLHLNDAKGPRGSRRDRHEDIGAGTLGEGPFRKIMSSGRFRSVFKVIETPKGRNPMGADQRNLALLRSFRSP